MGRKGIRIQFRIDMSGRTIKEIIMKQFYLWKYKCEDCGTKYRAIHVCRHE